MTTIAITLPISGMSEAERERRASYIRGLVPEDVEFDLLISPTSPKFLDAAEHFGDAVDAAEGFFADIDPARYGVVVVAGALDPGLDRLRAASPVPVVGPGEASLYVASVAGRPLSVVTVDEFAVAATHQFLAAVRSKPPIASVRSMEMPVREILEELPRGRARLVEGCRRAVDEDGAEALYLGSMTLGTLGVAEELRQALGVAVFNPWPIAMAVALRVLEAAAPAA